MSKIVELREDTKKEALELLNKYGKVCIVRPTGFGKTGILTDIIKGYKHVLYLYPAEIVKKTVLNFYYGHEVPVDTEIPNCDFCTYMMLIRMKKKHMKELFLGDNPVDLIVTDEAHKLGAKETIKAMQRLLEVLSEVPILGATATPERMDLVDEVSMFFDNRVVQKYTLHDAFTDGILKKPYYCFCSYTNEADEVEQETKREIEKLSVGDREQMYALLKSRLIEISNLSKMENVIRETCDQYIESTDYMKFIVFFASHDMIDKKKASVEKWFKDAYPEHEINSLTVIAKKEYKDNVERLDELKYKEKRIDLILCCDMLNLGYHVNTLTGIVMYRGTSSGIIYIQQLGRVLSSGNMIPGVVFDVVDNLHREAMYDMLLDRAQMKSSLKRRYQILKRRLEKAGVDPEKNIDESVVSDDLLDEEEKMEWKMLVDMLEKGEFSLTVDSDGDVGDGLDKWWWFANTLRAEDLIATGHEATYRELIAKTVAEPVSMRCRQAWARWVEKGGVPEPKVSDFILSQKAPNAVPLSPFCKAKSVSVQAVLDVMGVV